MLFTLAQVIGVQAVIRDALKPKWIRELHW